MLRHVAFTVFQYELRKELLPKYPNIENCLYGNRAQLENTAKYHVMALRGL